MKQIMILAAVCILLTACKKNNEPTDCERLNLGLEMCESFEKRMYPNEKISEANVNWYTATIEGEQISVSDQGPWSMSILTRFDRAVGPSIGEYKNFAAQTYFFDTYSGDQAIPNLLLNKFPVDLAFFSSSIKIDPFQPLTYYADSLFAVGPKIGTKNPTWSGTNWGLYLTVRDRPLIKSSLASTGYSALALVEDSTGYNQITITKLEKEDKGTFVNYVIWIDFQAKLYINNVFFTNIENGKAKFTIPVEKEP